MNDTTITIRTDERLKKDYSHTYPEGFFDLFGADDDARMKAPEKMSFDADAKKAGV